MQSAVALAKHIEVMVAAIVISVLVMMVVSAGVSRFIDRYPTIKVLALAFLVLVGAALIAQSLGILGMKDRTKALRSHFFPYQAGVLEYCLVRGQKISVGPNRDDELGYCIDDCSKFSFGFGLFVERPL